MNNNHHHLFIIIVVSLQSIIIFQIHFASSTIDLDHSPSQSPYFRHMPFHFLNIFAIHHSFTPDTLVQALEGGTVFYRVHNIFLLFLDIWTLLNKISKGVALTCLGNFHKSHFYAN